MEPDQLGYVRNTVETLLVAISKQRIYRIPEWANPKLEHITGVTGALVSLKLDSQTCPIPVVYG